MALTRDEALNIMMVLLESGQVELNDLSKFEGDNALEAKAKADARIIKHYFKFLTTCCADFEKESCCSTSCTKEAQQESACSSGVDKARQEDESGSPDFLKMVRSV